MLKLDFSDVKVIEVLPVGAYPVVVTNAEVQEGKEYPYIAWEFTIEEGPAEGRKLWNNTSTSPKALWKLKETLLALGGDPAKLAAEVVFDPAEYVGARAVAIVNQEQRKDSDEMRNVVSKLHPAKAGTAASGTAKSTLKFR
jgi:hypothetical protein